MFILNHINIKIVIHTSTQPNIKEIHNVIFIHTQPGKLNDSR
jgi:hypothetical protein